MACVGRFYSRTCLALAIFFLSSCSGSHVSTSQVLDETQTKPTLAFAEWCATWRLQCEAPAVLPKPMMTLEQLQTGFSLFNELLNTPMHFGFSAQDWKSSNMKEAFQSFSLSKSYEELTRTMDNVGFLGFVAEGDGRVQLNFVGKEFFGPSALRWHLAPFAEVSFGNLGSSHFSGWMIQNPAGQEVAQLLAAQATSEDTFALEWDLFRVEDVPLWFVSREIVSGISIPVVQKVPFQNLGVGLNRLLKVALEKRQEVAVPKSVLNSLKTNFDVLVPQPQKSPLFWHDSLKTILAKLEKFSVVAGDGKAELSGQLVGKDFLYCTIEGTPMAMEVRKDFGMSIPVQVAPDRVVMSFRGIAAKLNILGKPGFNLSAVEYTGDKMIIKGVPLMGEFTVDVTKNAEKMDLKCR